MSKRDEITIPAMREEIPQAMDFIEGVMTSAGFSRLRVLEVQLAVEEACTNTALHGYEDGKGYIRITSDLMDGRLILIIEDEGKAFDPTKAAPPSLVDDVDKRPIGGLGVHLMRTFVDGFRYEFKNGKNNLILTIKAGDK